MLTLRMANRATVKIVLQNPSSLPVSFLTASFTDSHTTATRNYIVENEPDAAEAYGIERDLQDRPVFKWDPPEEGFYMGPGEEKPIEVECIGKLGWCAFPFKCSGSTKAERESLLGSALPHASN
jgi:Transport protein Trs120 or TRAPPC9, TRAPP II complex subunit